MERIKNKTLDVIVGIPTFNEADSIANTLRKMDRGLARYFPHLRSLIVNIDSKSTDGTSRIFLSTITQMEKLSVAGGAQPRGKGANIFLLLGLVKKFGAKYVVTVDADTTTITEEWLKLLLDPVIQGRVDFVAPKYSRNRYEGNTTNHFCFPLLYAWFGKKLHQPIGGDFAFNNRFADYVLEQQKPSSSLLYGIDIFLSVHAVGAGFKIGEAYLGRKLHKPSFEKIVPMFKQVAATMAFALSRYRMRQDAPDVSTGEGERIDSLIRKPNQAKIESLKRFAFQSLRRVPSVDARKFLGLDAVRIASILKKRVFISEDAWIEMLAVLSIFIASHTVNDKDVARIAATLSPFFFLRVLSYFDELKQHKTQNSVAALILNQAETLRNLLVPSSKALTGIGSSAILNSSAVRSKSGTTEVEKL